MARTIETTDVIVIGGGVAGLAAARELSRAKLRVILLEARPRWGGRIFTRRPRGWPQPIELGAEFIHVGNPDLWRLAKRARLRVERLQGRHWLWLPDRWEKLDDLDKRIGRVTRQIKPRQAGHQSFAAYFRTHAARVTPEDWVLARSFVEGFEAAPLDQISARSLAGETMDDRHQYHLPQGYDHAVASLVADCEEGGVSLRHSQVVRSVAWARGRARVVTRAGKTHAARAVIITLPLGVLQARRGPGAVQFQPRLKQKEAAIRGMGMGDVSRMVVRFRAAAWRRLWPRLLGAARPGGFGFVHSRVEGMPVWWSLSAAPVLVGWAGGPAAKALSRLPAAAQRLRALRSLAEILGVSLVKLKAAVLGCETWDWIRDPFSRGAYSFTRAGGDAGGERLRQPERGTLFFAGEATADGAEVGTVHGALGSGIRAAREVIGKTTPRPRPRS